VHGFTARVCGLASPRAKCSCPRRLDAAQALRRLPPAPAPDTPGYIELRDTVARVEADLKTITLQRATGRMACPTDLTKAVIAAVDPPG